MSRPADTVRELAVPEFRSRLRALACRMVGRSRADDLLQDAAVNLLGHTSYAEVYNPKGYVRRVVMAAGLMQLRRDRTHAANVCAYETAEDRLPACDERPDATRALELTNARLDRAVTRYVEKCSKGNKRPDNQTIEDIQRGVESLKSGHGVPAEINEPAKAQLRAVLGEARQELLKLGLPIGALIAALLDSADAHAAPVRKLVKSGVGAKVVGIAFCGAVVVSGVLSVRSCERVEPSTRNVTTVATRGSQGGSPAHGSLPKLPTRLSPSPQGSAATMPVASGDASDPLFESLFRSGAAISVPAQAFPIGVPHDFRVFLAGRNLQMLDVHPGGSIDSFWDCDWARRGRFFLLTCNSNPMRTTFPLLVDYALVGRIDDAGCSLGSGLLWRRCRGEGAVSEFALLGHKRTACTRDLRPTFASTYDKFAWPNVDAHWLVSELCNHATAAACREVATWAFRPPAHPHRIPIWPVMWVPVDSANPVPD